MGFRRVRNVARVASATALLTGLAAGTVAQEREIPLSDDFLVQECLGGPADERDRCLAGLAVRSRNPAICEASPGNGCQSFVARSGVAECARNDDDAERHQCEIAVLLDYPSLDACDKTIDPNTCVVTVAAARKEPHLVAENIKDARDMQVHMSAYVAMARDLRGLDYIEDPFIHDTTLVYSAAAVGYGQDRELGTEYCSRLRGGYGPGHQDMNAKTVRALCGYVSGLSDSLLAAEQTAEGDTRFEQRLEETMTRLQSTIEQLESGAVTLSEVVPRLTAEDVHGANEEDSESTRSETPPEVQEGAYGRKPPDLRALQNLVQDDGWLAESSCKTVDSPPPYYIGIAPVDAACPEGWIRRGQGGRDTGNRFRWCAYCGEGFQSRLSRFNCCVRER